MDIQASVELQLHHRRGAPAGPVPTWVAEALGPGGTPSTHEKVLTWLLREELHLRCGCGRMLHVVRGTTLYLRRNPRQALVGNGRNCILCESDGSASASLQAFRRVSRDGIGPVMRIPVRAADAIGPEREEGSRGGSGARYAGTFAVLWQIMERAGFLELSSRIGFREVWHRMYRVLDDIPHSGTASAALSRFSWMPGPRYSGGLRDLNARVCAEWRHRDLQPEAWVFGIVRQLPTPGDGRVPVQVELAVSEYVYKLTVAPHGVARVGTVGPFLAFAVGSPVPVANHAVPKIHRVVFQMIAAEGNPVPVESTFEREAVHLLQDRGLSFQKPVFADRDGFRPDVLLPDHRIVIEIQGLSDPEYVERKARLHRDLLAAPSYRGWRLVRYTPAAGERIRDLGARLPR